jgi:cytochrome oxidase Cu insertion factor (SCO1/SenC/PrrC family)
MPGMNNGLTVSNSTLHAAFVSALLHQGILALLAFTVLAIAWVSIREAQPRRTAEAGAAISAVASRVPEPSWRALLRIGFGAIWIVDGLLQAQPAMVVGLPSQVIQAGAAKSPAWVQHLASWAGTSWSAHPIQAAAAAVWIQVGIGVWMLAARRGPLSRLAGLASCGWGLIVWVFGEAFGGIFAPGLTVMFGAPGAVLFYCVAGALIALPERSWHTPRAGRLLLAGTGVFLVGMATLQAWPGRGFWQGSVRRQPGSLTSMIQSMERTPQPGFLAGWVRAFGSFVAAHGFAVNLFAVVAFALIGAALLTARPRLAGPAAVALTVLGVADWTLIEDGGVFGGLGTDPNSMIPMALIVVAGYLALTPAPRPASQPADAARAAARPEPGWPGSWRPGSWRLSPGRLGRAFGAADARMVVAIWAVGLTVLGAFPMSAAAASRTADPIVAQALGGPPSPLSFTAPAFSLTSQRGTQVSLASLRGKVVLLTFLDPVCTTDCPLIAQEFRQADQVLGASAGRVELVAIDLNPVYRTTQYTRAFDQQERLAKVPNWLYLTGSLGELRRVWHDYGIAAQAVPAGGMILHSDVAYVIDESGRTRAELNMNPGPGTSTIQSSFAVVLASAARRAMKPA